MWRKIDTCVLPEDLEAVTSSVWQLDDIARVGVMRGTLLVPPYLWVEVYRSSLALLRQARGLLDEFQITLHAPVVYAESEDEASFLRFLGFTYCTSARGRHLYLRSLN